MFLKCTDNLLLKCLAWEESIISCGSAFQWRRVLQKKNALVLAYGTFRVTQYKFLNRFESLNLALLMRRPDSGSNLLPSFFPSSPLPPSTYHAVPTVLHSFVQNIYTALCSLSLSSPVLKSLGTTDVHHVHQFVYYSKGLKSMVMQWPERVLPWRPAAYFQRKQQLTLP